MRQAARTDDNQSQIVDALRRVGASVEILSGVGNGCPDTLVGYRGLNYILEIKDGRKPPNKRRLTPAEAKWHSRWRGRVWIVECVEDALRVIGALAA